MTLVSPNPWPGLAANFAARFPRAALHAAAVEAVGARPADEAWCVAFSGGSDSLALLLLLWAHWPERRSKLTALHFNHGLRGEASDGDERFCREVCVELAIGFSSSRWSGGPPQPNEAETRDARQAFFTREMEARGSLVLWTGHQKDDIAETLLMRLSRGSGPAGLAAPRPVSVRDDGRIFLRPLLTLGKSELAAALSDAGMSWREDASNTTRDHFRNRIRYEVLPRWQDAAFRSVLGGAALSRELCEEDDVALEAWLESLAIIATETSLDLSPLLGKPRALWRRALRRWPPVGAMSRAGFDDLLARCATGGEGRMSLSEGFAVVKNAVVTWEHSPSAIPWSPILLREGLPVLLPDGAELVVRQIAIDPALKRRVMSGGVDREQEAFLADVRLPLSVRPWQPGDRFRPLGAPGSAKLQDLFVNRKISTERRGLLPVVCGADDEILWVPGFSPAEHAKVTAQSSSGVQLTYRRGTSTLIIQS
jgi:tRNA(Ile)-lysidine synthase